MRSTTISPRASVSRTDHGAATAVAVHAPFAEVTVPARFVADGVTAAIALVSRLVAAVGRGRRRRQATRYLMDLDDHLLRDLGIRREEIPYVVRGSRAPGW